MLSELGGGEVRADLNEFRIRVQAKYIRLATFQLER